MVSKLLIHLNFKRSISTLPFYSPTPLSAIPIFSYRFPVMTGSMSVDVLDVAWVTLKVTFLKSMIPKLMSSSIASSSPKSRRKKWIVITSCYVLPLYRFDQGYRSQISWILWTKKLGSPRLHCGLQTADDGMIDFMSLPRLENTSYLAQSRLPSFM